jgi:hypothetical protein
MEVMEDMELEGLDHARKLFNPSMRRREFSSGACHTDLRLWK